MTRPLCECHGEPMHKMGRTSAGRQRWFCSLENRYRTREQYDSMSGVEYARKLLLMRRRKALARKKRREESSGSLPDPR